MKKKSRNRTNDIIFKRYNLTGKTVKIRWNDSPDASVWSDVWLPVKIIAEYPKFLIGEVQPHVNPNNSFGISKPYRIGLNKTAIAFGEINLVY